MSNEPDQATLRKLFDYDPATGNLIWKVARSNRIAIGQVAGCLNKHLGYWIISIKHGGVSRRYYRHRLNYIWQHGAVGIDEQGKTLIIDHVEGIDIPGFDRIENLRQATAAQNAMNKVQLHRNNTSKAKGVWQAGSGRWTGRLTVGRRKIGLGRFDSLEAAVVARQAAERQHFGEFARARSFAGMT